MTTPADAAGAMLRALNVVPDGATEIRPLRETSLAALVSAGVPPPDLMCGDMLYAGGLHSISGPPDSGKTTIALWWLLSLARAGHTVMFLDEEGGDELVAEKLIALGATAGEAERIRYFPFPARTWTPGDVTALRATVDELKPSMMLWDSSAAFLSRAGLDENSASDVTRFWAQVLTPVAREAGVAVVVIDHDTKSGDASRFARGSSAKLAGCDVAMKVSIVRAFDRATDGALRLTVSKDRRGWLHRFWDVVVQVGVVMCLDFRETTEPDTAPGAAEHTPATAKVLAALTGEPSDLRQIGDRIADRTGSGLRRETVSRSLNELLTNGLADRLDNGPGKSALWTVSAGQTCDGHTPRGDL
ncbi:MAG TPA: AAA family ATPase [Streptosporangiaceae bacterium]|jgi:hypothetical protein